jgi:GNAT superfamily N-acetyltransferase
MAVEEHVEPPTVRGIHRDSDEEILWVAERMRHTLEGVLGEERGRDMYTPEWLEERVRFHLDTEQCKGEVFVADGPDGLLGHVIVRVETYEDRKIGLISTIFVEPAIRGGGLGTMLLERAEDWMRNQILAAVHTCTAKDNGAVISLLEQRGYETVVSTDEMVRLKRML